MTVIANWWLYSNQVASYLINQTKDRIKLQSSQEKCNSIVVYTIEDMFKLRDCRVSNGLNILLDLRSLHFSKPKSNTFGQGL